MSSWVMTWIAAAVCDSFCSLLDTGHLDVHQVFEPDFTQVSGGLRSRHASVETRRVAVRLMKYLDSMELSSPL
jgi:hypothetical protein